MIIKLLDHQAKALENKSKYIALISGIGGGKTWTGIHWVIKMSKEYPHSLGFIGANTFAQLRNSTLAALFNELMRIEIPFEYNQSSGIITVMGKRWLCKSMDNFDVLRGIEIGECWLDECAYMKEEAFKVISGRLRDKKGALKMFLTTTPKGFTWTYHYFHENGENKLKDSVLIKSKSKDNSFLPDGYLDSLLEQYDSKLVQQELDGEFVNVFTGRVCWAFKRETHVAGVKYDPKYPLWAGMDFNINPMTCVIGQIYNDTLYVIDEFFLKDSNTQAMCAQMKAKYGDKITVVPDSTGNKTTTNSSRSDHTILKDAGFTVKSAHNPYRVNRYAAINAAIEKSKVVISPKCRMLCKDLEQLSYKEGTDKPDTTDSSLGHIFDAVSYLVYRTVNPLRNRSNLVIGQF